MVDPAEIDTLAGDTVTFDGSLLLKVTMRPPAGAGAPIVIGKATGWPGGTLKFAGRPIVPPLTTVTVAVVSPKAGNALA